MARKKNVIAATVVAALAGGGMLLASAPALAYNGALPAPWEPDPQSNGAAVIFYSSTGLPMTQGNSLSLPFAYAEASTAGPAGDTKASIAWAFPNHAQPTSNWAVDAPGASTTYPATTAPAPVNGFSNPVNTVGTSGNITAISGFAANDTTTGYNHVLQVRENASGTGGATTQYWSSDIVYNSANGTWQEIGNAAQQDVTYTALVANPTSTPAGNSVTFTATITSVSGANDPGTVNFYDGNATTPLNASPIATSTGATETAAFSTSALAAGAHTINAIFTPTATTVTQSSGTTTETITGPSTATTLAVSATNPSNNQPSGAPYAAVDTTLSGTVAFTSTTGTPAGTVSFFDNGSATPINSSPVAVSGTGTYTFDDAAGFTAGSHSVVAVFAPTNPATAASSQSAPVAFNAVTKPSGPCTNSASVCTDTQSIEAGIPVGTITITTPYNGTSCTATGTGTITPGTAPNPNQATSTPGCVAGVLNIGTLALTSTNSMFTASTQFQDIAVTDNLSGTQTWTVSAQSSNLTDGGTNAGSTINSQNVGLTNLVQNAADEGSNVFTGTVTPTNNPAEGTAAGTFAAAPTSTTADTAGETGLGLTPHLIASATSGQGTYAMDGTITLNAPTTTEAGVFTGTITFTVAAT